MPAKKGPRGRPRQREQLAVRVTHLRECRIVALNVVPEHDLRALQPATSGRDIVDMEKRHSPAGDFVVGRERQPALVEKLPPHQRGSAGDPVHDRAASYTSLRPPQHLR
jgi:hypothetical protein